MVEKEGEPAYFAIQLLVWILFPAQGLVNFFVYTRPRYIQWRQMHIHKGRWFAFRKAISLEPVSATAHLQRSTAETAASSALTRVFQKNKSEPLASSALVKIRENESDNISELEEEAQEPDAEDDPQVGATEG